jgi:hypothetical protein
MPIAYPALGKEKNMKGKLAMILMALCLLGGGLFMTGCDTNGGGEEGGNGSGGSGVDWTNYTTGYSIKVRNNTSERLVAFKGPPASDTLISGIPPGGGAWGLKKDPALFSSAGDFVLWLITEAQYNQHKDNLSSSALKQVPFTRIYAYYNTRAESDPIVYPINEKLGGQYKIVLNNLNTGRNVELRLDSPNGDTLGYAAEDTVSTTFNVDTGQYYIFPVFRKFSRSKGEIISVFPRNSQGRLWLVNRLLGPPPDGVAEYQINANDFLSNVVFKTGMAYLIIYNDMAGPAAGAVDFKKGGTAQRTSTGASLINPAMNRMYEIAMSQIGSEQNADFAEKLSVSKGLYQVGSDAGVNADLPAFEFYGDKVYEVHVTGTSLYDFSVGEITELENIDFKNLN